MCVGVGQRGIIVVKQINQSPRCLTPLLGIQGEAIG